MAGMVADKVWGLASYLIDLSLGIFSEDRDRARARGAGTSSTQLGPGEGEEGVWAGSLPPPTDQELSQRGLGFSYPRTGTSLPPVVAREIDEKVMALRTGSTPRREGPPPSPPSEIQVAVAMAKQDKSRTSPDKQGASMFSFPLGPGPLRSTSGSLLYPSPSPSSYSNDGAGTESAELV